MRTLLHSLMAAMLGIHAMLGCCWHHVDECGGCPQETAAAEAHKDCHHVCLGGRHAELPGADHEHPVPAQPCEHQCQGVCTYLGGMKSVDDASHASLYAVGLFASPAPLAIELPRVVLRSADVPVPQPPQRLYLVQQALLI